MQTRVGVSIVAAALSIALCLVVVASWQETSQFTALMQERHPNARYEDKYFNKIDADYQRASIMIRHRLKQQPKVPMPPQHPVQVDDVKIDRSRNVGDDLRAAAKEAEDAIHAHKKATAPKHADSWNPLSWFETSVDSASQGSYTSHGDRDYDSASEDAAATTDDASEDAVSEDAASTSSSAERSEEAARDREYEREMQANLAKQRAIRRVMSKEQAEIAHLQGKVHSRQSQVAHQQQDVANREARIAQHLAAAAAQLKQHGISAHKARESTVVHVVRNGPVHVNVNAAPKHDLVIDVDNEKPASAHPQPQFKAKPVPSLRSNLERSARLLKQVTAQTSKQK